MKAWAAMAALILVGYIACVDVLHGEPALERGPHAWASSYWRGVDYEAGFLLAFVNIDPDKIDHRRALRASVAEATIDLLPEIGRFPICEGSVGVSGGDAGRDAPVAWVEWTDDGASVERGFVHHQSINDIQYSRRSWPAVLDRYRDDKAAGFRFIRSRGDVKIGSRLSLADVAGDFNRFSSGLVSLPSEVQGNDQKPGADANESGGNQIIQSHSLGGFVHRLRGGIHALLGDKIVLLALGGFFFAALAGLGGGLILDHYDRERKRKRLGWGLLLCSIPLAALSFLLGLP